MDKLIQKGKERGNLRRGFVLMEGDFLKALFQDCEEKASQCLWEVWMAGDWPEGCLLSWLGDPGSETRAPPLGASLVLSVHGHEPC